MTSAREDRINQPRRSVVVSLTNPYVAAAAADCPPATSIPLNNRVHRRRRGRVGERKEQERKRERRVEI
jgi:hypothetical protein